MRPDGNEPLSNRFVAWVVVLRRGFDGLLCCLLKSQDLRGRDLGAQPGYLLLMAPVTPVDKDDPQYGDAEGSCQ